jgi:hypothetical protein
MGAVHGLLFVMLATPPIQDNIQHCWFNALLSHSTRNPDSVPFSCFLSLTFHAPCKFYAQVPPELYNV